MTVALALWVLAQTVAHPSPQVSLQFEDERIVPADPGAAAFGCGVAVQGGLLAVGATGASPKSKVFVYEWTSGLWSLSGEVVLPPEEPEVQFGSSLSLDGSLLVVADGSNTNSKGTNAGAVFVYEDSSGTFCLQAKLLASNGTQQDNFGVDLDIDQGTLVVGAWKANGAVAGAGAAYLFESIGGAWQETGLLVPSAPETQARFGASVAIFGDTIAVGSSSETGAVFRSGVVYVFRRNGTSWSEEARLFDPGSSNNACFGGSVALEDDRLLVGVSNDEEIAPNAGAVWVYERSGTDWQAVAKLFASDSVAQSGFGHRVALAGGTAIVSRWTPSLVLPTGAYHFQRTGAGWVERARLLNSDSQQGTDNFGWEVAFDGGNRAIVAAPGLQVGASWPGAVYSYVLDVPPSTYCTPKLSSGDCLPTLGWQGKATATGPDDFVVTVTDTAPQKPGLLFFGLSGPAAVPFLGGTLCVQPPLGRTPPLLSTPGTGCAGTYACPFGQALMAQAGIFPGDTVHAQVWTRDPDHPDGTGSGLSDGIELYVQP